MSFCWCAGPGTAGRCVFSRLCRRFFSRSQAVQADFLPCLFPCFPKPLDSQEFWSMRLQHLLTVLWTRKEYWTEQILDVCVLLFRDQILLFRCRPKSAASVEIECLDDSCTQVPFRARGHTSCYFCSLSVATELLCAHLRMAQANKRLELCLGVSCKSALFVSSLHTYTVSPAVCSSSS